MCNNCINNCGCKATEKAAMDMALNSDIWFSGEAAKAKIVAIMCRFSESQNSTTQAKNEELEKQISALTQALETQNRENHPYIKELKSKIESAKLIIEAVVINYETNPEGVTYDIIEKAKEFLGN